MKFEKPIIDVNAVDIESHRLSCADFCRIVDIEYDYEDDRPIWLYEHEDGWFSIRYEMHYWEDDYNFYEKLFKPITDGIEYSAYYRFTADEERANDDKAYPELIKRAIANEKERFEKAVKMIKGIE